MSAVDVLAVIDLAIARASGSEHGHLKCVRGIVRDSMAALERASEMLRIAGPIVGEHAEEVIVRYDSADCDGSCIKEDCRDAADVADDCLARCKGEGA